MAYIGAQPNKTLTKTTSQSFNGTGSATVFTLNRAVNTEEELEVFVENVQQEPGSGKSYTASGTTLTFDEAPPSGTGNIYVIYRGLAEVTTRLEHDANQALSATTGTFTQLNSDNIRIDGNTISSTDTNGDITLDPNGTGRVVVDAGHKLGVGTTPDRDLHVKGASGDPVHLKLEGDPADYARIMFDDGTNDNIGEIRYHFGDENLRFTVNAAERMRIASDGKVGIGVTDPEASLTVANGVSFEGGLTAGTGVGSSGEDGDLRFYTNSNQKLTLDTGGRLLLDSEGGGANEDLWQAVSGRIGAAGSGTSKKVIRCGHTCSGTLHVIVKDSYGVASAAAIFTFAVSYGSPSVSRRNHYSSGNITNVTCAYNNGGSPNYTLDITVTYTGNSPTIYANVQGISHTKMYVF